VPASLEREGLGEQRQPGVDLIAGYRQLSRPSKPGDCVRSQSLGRSIVAWPGEVHVFGADSLRIVVTEEGSELVAPLTDFLQPPGEGSMQPRPARFRQATVRDLSGERMLESPLALSGHR
jgi:hypothetical protein